MFLRLCWEPCWALIWCGWLQTHSTAWWPCPIWLRFCWWRKSSSMKHATSNKKSKTANCRINIQGRLNLNIQTARCILSLFWKKSEEEKNESACFRCWCGRRIFRVVSGGGRTWSNGHRPRRGCGDGNQFCQCRPALLRLYHALGCTRYHDQSAEMAV